MLTPAGRVRRHDGTGRYWPTEGEHLLVDEQPAMATAPVSDPLIEAPTTALTIAEPPRGFALVRLAERIVAGRRARHRAVAR